MHSFSSLALWFFLANVAQSSQFLDPQKYIMALTSPPYQKIHASDCCIKSYSQENELIEVVSGTYMETFQSKNRFVLTTSHIEDTHHLTVTLAGENREYILKGYKTLLSEFMVNMETIPPSVLRLIRWFYGADIAIAFIQDYGGSCEPAHFVPEPCFPQDSSCSLSGYGDLIALYSNRRFLIPVDNESRQQCLLTMSVSAKSGIEDQPKEMRRLYNQNRERISSLVINLPEDVQNNPFYLQSIYKIPYSATATDYEQPARNGFSGATLRDQTGNVIGVAVGGEAGLINHEMTLRSPSLAKLSHSYWKIRQSLIATTPYRLALLFGTIGFCILCMDLDFASAPLLSFGEASAATVLSIGVVCVLIQIIEWINSFYLHGAILPGARSYFSPTGPWLEKLSEMVNAYYAEQLSRKPQEQAHL